MQAANVNHRQTAGAMQALVKKACAIKLDDGDHNSLLNWSITPRRDGSPPVQIPTASSVFAPVTDNNTTDATTTDPKQVTLHLDTNSTLTKLPTPPPSTSGAPPRTKSWLQRMTSKSAAPATNLPLHAPAPPPARDPFNEGNPAISNIAMAQPKQVAVIDKTPPSASATPLQQQQPVACECSCVIM
jgi:hypothetical protein